MRLIILFHSHYSHASLLQSKMIIVGVEMLRKLKAVAEERQRV